MALKVIMVVTTVREPVFCYISVGSSMNVSQITLNLDFGLKMSP